MKTCIRSEWPRVTAKNTRTATGWKIDARRTGTNLKAEWRADRAEALKRAAEIDADYGKHGKDGLALSADLRYMATTGADMLKPYGVTILQACEHYRDILKARKEAQASALVPFLAGRWYEDKASGKNKKLRERTLADLEKAKKLIASAFPNVRILDVTTNKVQAYLDAQNVGLQRKYNLNSLFSQFFNWCITKGHLTKNPSEAIEIEVGNKEVTIFTPAQTEKVLEVCEKQFPAYVLYHAISLFAGLRPEECQGLHWENIHLEEKTIHVQAETSKIKEARNVHIEDNLAVWIERYSPENAKGYVTPQVNFSKYNLQVHIAAGYQGTKQHKEQGKVVYTKLNVDATSWPQDVMRHSYGSYWLATHNNRAELAEKMGNSLQIIKKHYKRVVSKADALAYWAILPDIAVRREGKATFDTKDMRRERSKRLAKALA